MVQYLRVVLRLLYLIGVEIRVKVYYNFFNVICLPVAVFFEVRLSGLCEFLMGFAKICFELDPRFMDWRKTIPGLDRLS